MLAKDSSKLWSWVEDAPRRGQEVTGPILRAASRVVAVLVAHNGEAWLPRTLAHLERLEIRPGMLIGVDADSTDESRLMLETTGIFDLVVDGNENLGYGDNVKLGLAAAGIDENIARVEFDWLWLLHDDTAVGKTSLTNLMASASGEDAPQVIFPKLLQPRRRNHPDKIDAVGESIAADGSRVSVVEPGQIDQGQLEPMNVLGGSTAGMLISLAAWQRLDGLSSEVPLLRDGVEFGMRANRAGLRVVTCPEASIRHIDATRSGLRDSKLAPEPDTLDIALGMMVAAGHAADVERASRKILFSARLNQLGHLLSKDHDRRRAAKNALTKFQTEKPAVHSIAEGAAKSGELENVDRELLPARFSELRHSLDLLAGKVADRAEGARLRPDPQARSGIRNLLSPGLVTATVLFVITLIACRGLIGFGRLSGPMLLPSPDSVGAAWHFWTNGTAGMIGANPPWLGLMALGSTLLLGQPEWFVSLVVLGGCSLSAASGFFFIRHLVASRWQAAALAAVWGLLLPLSGATGTGSLDAVAAAVLIPLLANVARAWLLRDKAGAESWRRPAHFALLAILLVSFVPLAWLPLAVFAFLIGRRIKNWKAALVAALGPVVVLSPWLPRLLSDPGRLLTGAEPSAAWAAQAPSPIGMAFGRSGYAHSPMVINILVVAVIWVLALVALYMLRTKLSCYLMGGALASLTCAIVLSRFVVTVNFIPVRPTCFVLMFCYLGCLIVLAALGIGKANQVASRDLRTLNFWLSTVTVLAVATAGVWWAIAGCGPLQRSTSNIPSYVQDTLNSERHTRALIMRMTDDTARYWLVDEAGASWGSGEAPALANRAANEQISDLAKQIAAGQPSDNVLSQLTQLAISHVVVSGVSDQAVQEFSSSSALTPIPVDDDTLVFSMPTNVSLLMFKDGKVILSEPKDNQWRAKAGDRTLKATDSGDWRQAWELNEKSSVEISSSPNLLSMVTQILGILALGILGAPAASEKKLPRRASRAETSAGRRGE